MKKHMIWKSDIDIDDWKDYFDELKYCFDEDLSDSEKWEVANELNQEHLEDERINLNIRLTGDIIAIGSIGTWRGTFKGYKEMKTDNIADCLTSLVNGCSEIEFFIENGNFKANEYHHDGINHYLYRQWRDGLTWTQKDNFLDKLYHGKASDRDIRRYTKSIAKEICKVYGWEA